MTKVTKKQLFMAKTLELIYEKGFKGTSMRDIAKNSSFEVPNVYNYITSKEAFLDGYLFSVLTSFHSYMDDVLESSHSPKDKLKYVISKHIQFTIDEPYQVALFEYDWRNLSEPRLGEFKSLRKSYLSKVGLIIEAGIEEGQFRKMDTEMATYLVFSALRWWFNLFINDDRKVNAFEFDKQISDFIFEGIDKK